MSSLSFNPSKSFEEIWWEGHNKRELGETRWSKVTDVRIGPRSNKLACYIWMRFIQKCRISMTDKLECERIRAVLVPAPTLSDNTLIRSADKYYILTCVDITIHFKHQSYRIILEIINQHTELAKNK